MPIKHLQKAATRIAKAARLQERIVLYGDSDLDGVTAVIILQEAIKSIGGNVASCYFPNREGEGYGLTQTALQALKPLAPGVLILLDLGISSFEEVAAARAMGFEVIIIDHHAIVRGKIPEADIVVDPKQPGDTSAFKEYAACGLSWLVSNALLKDSMSKTLRQSLIELAALGTIADMMVRAGDNELIIEEGTVRLEESWRPGIKAFFEAGIVEENAHKDRQIGYMISILNVRDVSEGLPAAFRLLTNPFMEEAKRMVLDLEEKQHVRQQRIQEIVQRLRDRILIKGVQNALVEGDESFDSALLGAASSILSRELQKPVFLYKVIEDEAFGSVRAPLGMDTVKAMEGRADLFMTYGGHPQASGFRMKEKNIPAFREHINEYFSYGNES
ncbi:MAG: DHH family phosphoesterase [Candidatus Wildermuthbacteria bacterium]|nr:DHH family phosphoesterase [Candidatus Wildermuthbacteria bacterium]MBI2121292.1 DHH family phosphoesterase [Candidatus Wildermuthbacteria bacterium]